MADSIFGSNTYVRWNETAASAAANLDGAWKQNGGVTYMLEHVERPFAARFLERVIVEFPACAQWIQELCSSNDARGGPTVHTFSSPIGDISSSCASLRYVYHALRMLHALRPEHVVEVGGGYGGLALIIIQAAKRMGHPLLSYTIHDLVGPRVLQRAYLADSALTGNTVLAWEEGERLGAGARLCSRVSTTALVSTYAVSEFDATTRDTYLENLVPMCGLGFFAWNCGEISRYLPKTMLVETEDPQTGQLNKLLLYGAA